jgi:hypothetical protein
MPRACQEVMARDVAEPSAWAGFEPRFANKCAIVQCKACIMH